MAKLSQSLVERFFQSVGTTAQEVYNSSPADLTIDAEIVSVVNASLGEYKVNYQDNIMSAFSSDVTVVYRTGERVYIIVPQGDMSKKKIILGRSYYQNSAETQDDPKNFFVDKGPNWAERYNANQDLGICACPKDNEGDLINPAKFYHFGFIREPLPGLEVPTRRYDGGSLTEETMAAVDNEFTTWGQSNKFLKIQAVFRTELSGIHNSGKYAIQVACLQSNPKYLTGESDEPYNVITYELNFSNFEGISPYAITDPSVQKGYFQIPAGGLLGIYSIGLIQDGDLQFDIPVEYDAQGMPVYNDTSIVKSKNNIFVSDIQICFAEQVELTNSLYYPYIEAPYGVTLYGPTPSGISRPSIDLIAHLKYAGADIVNDEHCRVHWFRQKADISQSSAAGEEKDEFGKTYFDYGGPGWYPVERIDAEQQSATGDDRLYKVDGNKLTIYLGAVPWKWKYKAVITYATTDTNSGTVSEIVTQYAIQEVNRADSKYDLELLPVETNLPGLYEIINHADIRGKVDWYGSWYEKGLDDGYSAISAPFHKGMFNILDNPFSSWSTLYVQCYDPDMYVPGLGFRSDAYEVGVLELDVSSETENPFVIDWTGDDHFQYDSQGSRKDKELQKYVLTPTLKFKPGCAFGYAVQVVAPDGTVLKDRTYYEEQYVNGWENKKGLVTSVFVDTNFGINFSIKPEYTKELAAPENNTFTIRIFTDHGQSFEFEKQITFSKDGDLGTNGTEWNMTLRPCRWKHKDAMGLFVEPYSEDEIVPLVVQPDPRGGYIQNNNYRLFLRPYVSKGGTALEKMDKEQAFFYRCYWDVRAPGSDSKNPEGDLASYLRLYHALRGDNGVAGKGRIFNCTDGGGWETGDLVKVGETIEAIRINDLESQKNGLVAHTVYPLSPESSLYTGTGENPFKKEENECYGAVEVCYFNNLREGTGASLEAMKYRFIVKCTVDICRGSYNYVTHSIETAAYSEVITTLVGYYPVDVFFDEDGLLTDISTTPGQMIDLGKNIDTNWPTIVKYDAIGYNPEHYDERLHFYLGTNEMDILPETLTPETINFEKYSITERSEEESGEEPKKKYWVQFRPINHLTNEDGYHGAYCTQRGAWPVGAGNDWFLRNVILYHNRYGNVDINGWDGQGIDTNEENGTIFGATFGAGWKGQFSNAFTGVLMGQDKNMPRSLYKDYNGDLKWPEEAEKSHPYLTGVFGYQEGVQSFGLLENGTAFFGRADRGGRIIIDGSNATIYGGANGMFTAPSIGDPMWNTLRINLVDLTHKDSGELWELDPNSSYTVGGTPVDILSYNGAGKPTGANVRDLNGNPLKVNLGGQSFGFIEDAGSVRSNDSKAIPSWYAKMWRNAYIVPFGAKPYWMLTKKDSTGKETTYELEDLGWWDGNDINYNNNPNDVSNNKRVNFFDTAWINLNDSEVSRYYPVDDTETGIPSGLEIYTRFPYIPPVSDIGAQQVAGVPTICIWSADKKAVPNPTYPELKARLDKIRREGKVKLHISSFGSQRASTTPAIEIGQYIPGLKPGLIGWGEYVDVYESQRIPGDRNFMVTYDGTLWAMNGVFMGNVIGANVIGGRIQASQIGVGPPIEKATKNTKIYTFYGPGALYNCDWKNLDPPTDAETNITEFASSITGFSMTMDQNGITTMGGELIGGSLDIGRFHIIGAKTLEKLEQAGIRVPNPDSQMGHLIQAGESDFIGKTHFFGNVGIGPAIDGFLNRTNSGSLIQTSGFVALGVLLPNSASGGIDLKCHQAVLNFAEGDLSINYYSGSDSSSQIGMGGSLEASSIFAIESRGRNPVVSDFSGGIKGHFWPVHFFSKKEDTGEIISYFTTMDQFKSKGEGESAKCFTDMYEGANYFRVSNWGAEGRVIFIRSTFQEEQSHTHPMPKDKDDPAQGAEKGRWPYRGYIGSVSRVNFSGSQTDSDTGAIGISSWNRNAVIFHSDEHVAVRARDSFYINAAHHSEVADDTAQCWTEKEGDKTHLANMIFWMTKNKTYGNVALLTRVSPIIFGVLLPDGSDTNIIGSKMTSNYNAVRTNAVRKYGAYLLLTPASQEQCAAGGSDTFDNGKPAAVLACHSRGADDPMQGGGVHIFCAPGDDGSIIHKNCRTNAWSETFWSANEIHSWAKDKNGMYSGSKIEFGVTPGGVHNTGDDAEKLPSFALFGDATAEHRYALLKVTDAMNLYMEDGGTSFDLKQVRLVASEDLYLDFNATRQRLDLSYKKGVTGIEIDKSDSGTDANFFINVIKNKIGLEFWDYESSNPIIRLRQDFDNDRKIYMDSSKFEITGYSPDQQFQIYARFG